VGLGAENAADLVELVGYDIGQLLVLADAHNGDEVDIPGDGVDLADTFELGDGGGDLMPDLGESQVDFIAALQTGMDRAGVAIDDGSATSVLQRWATATRAEVSGDVQTHKS